MKPLTRRVCCAARDREPAGRLARLCRYLAVAAIVLAAARSTVDAEPAGRPRVLELVVDVSGSTLAEQGGVAPPSGGRAPPPSTRR